MATVTETALVPNMEFAVIAPDAQIERTAEALKGRGFKVFVVDDGAQAREKVAELLPEGAEVFTAASATLVSTGIYADINESGRYNSVRARLAGMNPASEQREMNKMGAVPEYVVGSIHALTESGTAIIASGTGSQLAPYAAGAANVIWVVGAQKIVTDIEEGLRRMEEYSLALEDARALKAYGRHSAINKTLLVHRDRPGRITVVIVKEELGF